jgi:hypothetical protein
MRCLFSAVFSCPLPAKGLNNHRLGPLEENSFSSRMRRFFDPTEGVDHEAENGLPEVPVKIKERWRIPIMVVPRDEGDSALALSWEKERGRLHRYYRERDIAAYPTAERALMALGKVVSYSRQRETAGG